MVLIERVLLAERNLEMIEQIILGWEETGKPPNRVALRRLRRCVSDVRDNVGDMVSPTTRRKHRIASEVAMTGLEESLF